MGVGLNGVKIEYQEEVDKKINKLVSMKDSLQVELDRLTDDVLSGTAKAEIFKSELQSIIDYIQSMIDMCNTARNQMIDKGEL